MPLWLKPYKQQQWTLGKTRKWLSGEIGKHWRKKKWVKCCDKTTLKSFLQFHGLSRGNIGSSPIWSHKNKTLENIVELEQSEFNEYVQDETEFDRHAMASNSIYLG